jgi:mannosyltransferase OCH1-like enzyme
MLDYYNKINPKYGACRADLFRYLLMYKEGGVYLDIKSAIKYPLNKIILPDDEYILSYWDHPIKKSATGNSMGEYQQWHVICRPKHPFLYAVINDVIKNIDNYNIETDGVGKPGVLKVTGPIAYTKAIMPIVDKYNCRIVELNDYIGLIYNNLQQSHKNLFSKAHYSKISEPIIYS